MVEGSTALWAALIVALIAPLVLQLLKAQLDRRETSGNIQTSKAEDVWEASDNLMTHQREEISRLQEALTSCRDEVERLSGGGVY